MQLHAWAGFAARPVQQPQLWTTDRNGPLQPERREANKELSSRSSKLWVLEQTAASVQPAQRPCTWWWERTSSYLPAEWHKYCSLRASSSQHASRPSRSCFVLAAPHPRKKPWKSHQTRASVLEDQTNNVGSSKMLLHNYPVLSMPRPCALQSRSLHGHVCVCQGTCSSTTLNLGLHHGSCKDNLRAAW